MKRIVYCLMFVILLLGCSPAQRTETTTVDIGTVVDTSTMTTSFNEAQRMMIKTSRYNVVVFGYHSVKIGDKVTIKSYSNDGNKYLCVESSNECWMTEN